MATMNNVSPRAGLLASLEGRASEHARVGALDGIRGVAILLVLAFHYGNNANGEGLYAHFPFLKVAGFGWSGVDLFFVLSGFLITGILYEARNSENYFRNFYMRRVLRIFPLYYTALLIVVMLGALWPSGGHWGTESPLWVALFMSNFALIAHGGGAIGLLAHFWSLAIEEHFYLVWPLFVLLGTRTQLMVGAAVLAASALMLRTALAVSGTDPDVLFFLTPARMDALAIGAFCSLACRGKGGVAAIAKPAAVVALTSGTALILLILIRQTLKPNDLFMATAGYSLIGLLCGGIIVVSLTWQPLNAVVSHGLLRWFGRYSYGLYVWHPIVNTIMLAPSLRVVLDPKLFQGSYLLLMLGTVILISLASFHLLEKPFLRLKGRFE